MIHLLYYIGGNRSRTVACQLQDRRIFVSSTTYSGMATHRQLPVGSSVLGNVVHIHLLILLRITAVIGPQAPQRAVKYS